jgi:hypothetical protein
MTTPAERRIQERRKEIRDHRRYLKKDGRFIQVTRRVRRLPPGRERELVLRDFWNDVYQDPLTQAQGEYLAILGQMLAEYIHLLDEERVDEGGITQGIHPHAPPPPPPGAFEARYVWREQSHRREFREQFWDCSDVGTIEEHRSSAVTGLGGLAPQ